MTIPYEKYRLQINYASHIGIVRHTETHRIVQIGFQGTGGCLCFSLTGEDSASSRKSKLEQIKLGHFHVLIATGQLIGEGMDINTLERLFLVYPFAFEGKLIQYIGRVQRSEKAPFIYDYRDSQIDFFEKLFKKRNRYYKRLMKYPVVWALH